MKNKTTRLIVLILLMVLMITFFFSKERVTPIRTATHLTINGKVVNFTDELGYPLLIKETQRTIVPIRIISEDMGYKVDWSKDTWAKGPQKVWISDSETKIEIEIGKRTAIVNGRTIPMDVDADGKVHNTQAMLIPVRGSSRTYVPLRFIAEAMGAELRYERKNNANYIDIWTGKVDKPKDVSFIEPEIIVTQMTHASHVPNYFTMRLGNRDDYKDTGITISTELTNWPDFVEYRLPSPDSPGYFTTNDNKYYSNWNYKKISGEMGRFYQLGNKNYARKVNKDEKPSIPKDGYILKYKVTVTVGNETKVYNIDVPFYNKKFK